MTKTLQEVFETPPSKRDWDWEQEVFQSFPVSELYLPNEAPFAGPDGFSYMELSTEPGGTKLNIEDFIAWASNAGVGLVLNLKENKSPDYVFSYGMVWNFLLRKSFVNPVESQEKTEGSILIHQITEGYLPSFVRENISEFLKSNGVREAEISLISHGDGTPYEILFYFEDLKDLDETGRQSLLEALSWFLPLDYKLNWATSKEEVYAFQPIFTKPH